MLGLQRSLLDHAKVPQSLQAGSSDVVPPASQGVEVFNDQIDFTLLRELGLEGYGPQGEGEQSTSYSFQDMAM